MTPTTKAIEATAAKWNAAVFQRPDSGWTYRDDTEVWGKVYIERGWDLDYTAVVELVSPHPGKISAQQGNFLAAVRRAVKHVNPGAQVTIDQHKGGARLRVWAR